uniref:ZP domain-containing protein n=1 Tax=Neogobius melanostomus TaxID=47308 RepID=A0A8C6UQK7_9GOBI
EVRFEPFKPQLSRSIMNVTSVDPISSKCSSSPQTTVMISFFFTSIRCGERSFCSIVGPSVVDFNGVTGAVPDFCGYSILFSQSRLKVVGLFRERRLTDVPFLDSVFISTRWGNMGITPGGRVDLNDITSSLTSTATRHVGADISKDDSGITVTYTDSSLTRITLFYDGALLHVTQEVPTGSLAYDEGLCSVFSLVFTDCGFPLCSCDVVTVDAAGENIDCSAVQTRCSDLLATLSSPVDRSAFITACADNLLCHYPDVDGLACHFLDAYARTSRLSVPREASGFCVDHFCSGREFCAVKDSGDAACYCRIFTSYVLGGVATCSGDSASLTIYTCFLEEAGFDHSELHLNDFGCTGSYDADQHLLTFGFNSSHPCGGTLQVVFVNQVQNSRNSIITFKKQFSMDFSCAYTQPSTPSTASFRIHDGSVPSLSNTGTNFTFTLDMGLFTDAAFSSSSTVTNSTELELNQEVFVRLKAQDIGADTLALVIDDCWTTTEATPTGADRYDLISNKCPVPSEETVTVPSNGEALVSYFKFNVFEYAAASTPDIFLHCQVSLCIVANGCVPCLRRLVLPPVPVLPDCPSF